MWCVGVESVIMFIGFILDWVCWKFQGGKNSIPNKFFLASITLAFKRCCPVGRLVRLAGSTGNVPPHSAWLHDFQILDPSLRSLFSILHSEINEWTTDCFIVLIQCTDCSNFSSSSLPFLGKLKFQFGRRQAMVKKIG